MNNLNDTNSPEYKSIKKKLQLLELANSLGNVAEACRITGYSRDSYYRFKKSVENDGIESLLKTPPSPKPGKRKLSREAEEAIIHYSINHPKSSSKTVAKVQNSRGIQISASGIRNLWIRHDIETTSKRITSLINKIIHESYRLDAEQLEIVREHFRSTKPYCVTPLYPGHYVILTAQYISTIKDIGTIYQYSLIDLFTQFRCVSLSIELSSKELIRQLLELNSQFAKQRVNIEHLIVDANKEIKAPDGLFASLHHHQYCLVKTPIGLNYYDDCSEFYQQTFQRKKVTSIVDLEHQLRKWIYDKNNSPIEKDLPKLSPYRLWNTFQNPYHTEKQDTHHYPEPPSIKTTVLEKYEYKYSSTKYVPADGKTLFFTGFNLDDSFEFVQEMKLSPAGFSASTSVLHAEGVVEEYKSQYGTQHVQKLIESYPNCALFHNMWMCGDYNIPQNLLHGEYDHALEKYGIWASQFKQPLFLTIGFDFDCPHNVHDPRLYIQSYRYVVDKLRNYTNNIAYVWNSWCGPTYQNHPVESWYPGDNYVDWFGITIINRLNVGAPNYYMLDFLELARLHRKPTMLCNTAATEGISSNSWENWFVPIFSMIYRYNIKAYIHTNCDFSSYPVWKFSGWENAKVQSNHSIAWKFKEALGEDRFILGGTDLKEQLEDHEVYHEFYL